MTEPNRLKCRWCGWSTPRWRRLTNGKMRHGGALLQAHALNAHYDYEYYDVLLQEEADWQADPMTMDEE